MKPERTDASSLVADRASDTIRRQVQYNCAISDAIYARDYTLCIYLLRMREFYRWQHDIPLGKHLSLDDVGDWVSQTEQYWDEIEELPFCPVRVGETDCDPFDSERINTLLQADKSAGRASLIYSAGNGRRGQPHFLLARGQCQSDGDDVDLYVCTSELARDINSPVAMARDNVIVISKPGLARMLWELYEEWSFHKNAGPMSRLSEHYGWRDSFDNSTGLERACTDLIDVLIAHEYGEVKAADFLPQNWQAMMHSAISPSGGDSVPTPKSSTNEFYMRAIRDNLADSLQTWPAITDRASSHCLDFWLASLGPVRKQMLGATDFAPVFATSNQHERLDALAAIIPQQTQHWQNLAQAMSEAYERDGPDCEYATLIPGCER